MTEKELQEQFDAVFEDLYCELAKFGHLLELHVNLPSPLVIEGSVLISPWLHCQVCDNVGDHLIGNVYARYEWEAEAQTAVDNLNDRWYAGKLLLGASMTIRCAELGFSVLTYFCSQADRCTRSCPPSRTFAKLAADRTKTANAIEAAFAISCIFGTHLLS